MILFTCDLDRTLIYSVRMMKQYPTLDDIVTVEKKEEQPVSFMTKKSIDLLLSFNINHLFIPVTTRSVEQYKRIHSIYKMINPKYAIVSNGGNILIDGKVDENWNELVRKEISTTSMPKEDVLNFFSRIRNDQWVKHEFEIDDLFYMFQIDQAFLPLDELNQFGKELRSLGWRQYVNGRKLYILPESLNKATAVKRLQHHIDFDYHVSAGDSLIDYEMITEANMGFSPKHGELFALLPEAQKVNWLKQPGAGSSDELMSQLFKLNHIYGG